MALHRCTGCPLRKRHDKNPGSVLGRLWRWHTRWCPGWKGYLKSLPEAERRLIKDRYVEPKTTDGPD
ncbi:MAG: hypothetical protein COZ70_11920 [Deltaproteobacteria bacterium CG_4_8_14_3_um_filter_51_11]|nr:MAG: hypothetical protein COX16_05720 [Deltaproteobacteria bacterium CG23_combo_of_CG06-09_8_20_14_all_51_20]PIW01665.1 MAG: hypothetical protein COW41_01985 [Deltaproteobacteria bacterium CG17_big_fil_post_rev_8_21_14_2_50_51_6]PIX18865.1 MAG: hypothetical protein COZ70_11920 [Deltaproteobacteria bacterium CG_4_8_14_3_um_filter_51_11]PIY27196.1 MAG: hypothetical protein COZ11_00500 [Deltaproteobacteria bacterium CG_4_10_14_3_um_filter_51_14]PJB36288.1 MAG: hypothetical protein CO107_08115 [